MFSLSACAAEMAPPEIFKDMDKHLEEQPKEVMITMRPMEVHFPDDGKVSYYYGAAMYEVGKQKDLALEALWRAYRKGYTEKEMYYYLGAACLDQKDYEHAEEFLKKALEKDRSAKVLNEWGILLKRNKRYEEAIPHFIEAAQLVPDDQGVLINLGDCYYDLKEYDKAIEYFEKSISINPEWAVPYTSLVLVYSSLKDIKMAFNSIQRGLKLLPDSPMLKDQLGVVYMDANQYNDAEAALLSVLENYPEYESSLFNISVLYFNWENYEKAYEYAQKLSELYPAAEYHALRLQIGQKLEEEKAA